MLSIWLIGFVSNGHTCTEPSAEIRTVTSWEVGQFGFHGFHDAAWDLGGTYRLAWGAFVNPVGGAG